MKLELDSMEVDCVIGDLPGEREREQTLVVEATLEIPATVAESDSLADTVDYAELAARISAALKKTRCRMIERAAKIVWDECMACPKTMSAKVRVAKKGSLPGLSAAIAEYGGEAAAGDGCGPTGIETIARGICVREGRLLVCRAKGGSTSYLPGGHVEFGESATEALKREMAEETGLEAEIGSFRGVVENSFMQKGARHCEMNLVFDMDIPSLRNGAEVVARESWIEFEWVKTDALAEAALLPEEFRRIGKEPSAFFRPHMV